MTGAVRGPAEREKTLMPFGRRVYARIFGRMEAAIWARVVAEMDATAERVVAVMLEADI